MGVDRPLKFIVLCELSCKNSIVVGKAVRDPGYQNILGPETCSFGWERV